MSGYKDRENEGLGPRRARFQTVRKQDKKAEVSFGTRGGRGCNCRVRRIVVRCYKKQVAGGRYLVIITSGGGPYLVAIWSL